MLVGKVLLVVSNAPFGVDRASPADDTRQAICRVRDEGEQHARVDREIVNTLFGLLDEGISEYLPGEIFSDAVNLRNGFPIHDDRYLGWVDPLITDGEHISGQYVGSDTLARRMSSVQGDSHFLRFFCISSLVSNTFRNAPARVTGSGQRRATKGVQVIPTT